MPCSTCVEKPNLDRRPVTDCPICLLQTTPHAALDPSQSLVCISRLVRRGETLFRAGDTFKSLYAVRVGCFKTIIFRDDHEQVTGFHIAGEPLGLDGVYSGKQNCDAVALEDSQVCVIPYDLLENLCHGVKSIQQHVHQMMSGEIVRGTHLAMMLGTMSAEQRVATFLTNMSSRMKARGYSAAEFNLRMTREEIGSYLGLKLETVSRMFSKLQRNGMVVMSGKLVKIIDSGRLSEL